jgi:hypothetical protein
VKLVLKECCGKKECASSINVNDQVTEQQLDEISIVNMCPECTESMPNQIS